VLLGLLRAPSLGAHRVRRRLARRVVSGCTRSFPCAARGRTSSSTARCPGLVRGSSRPDEPSARVDAPTRRIDASSGASQHGCGTSQCRPCSCPMRATSRYPLPSLDFSTIVSAARSCVTRGRGHVLSGRESVAINQWGPPLRSYEDIGIATANALPVPIRRSFTSRARSRCVASGNRPACP